ncbi:MAG: substrate-binding domain-containing protein, partial [Lachnospiraceae bacterium]
MKRRFMAMGMAVLLAGSLIGCASGGATTEAETKNAETKAVEASSAESGGTAEKVMIGLSMNTQTNPFFVSVQQGVKDAAAQYGIEIVATDAQDDPAIQAKDIENLIAMKPAAIIVDTCDSDAIIPSIEACNEAGIPVFTMDRKSNGGEVVAHIGYDAIKSGAMAADYLAKELGEKGKLVELQGIMGSNVAQDRHQGFSEQIQ